MDLKYNESFLTLFFSEKSSQIVNFRCECPIHVKQNSKFIYSIALMQFQYVIHPTIFTGEE